MKKKIHVFTAIAIMALWLGAGCGKGSDEPVFELGQGDLEPVSSQDAGNTQMSRDEWKEVLEEALASLEFQPVVQVSCPCTGETPAQQVTVDPGQANQGDGSVDPGQAAQGDGSVATGQAAQGDGSVATGQAAQGGGVAIGQAVPADDGKVNINTADVAALQTLNGIGEVRALAIIAYRENYGAFQSIEDIMQVDGIKDGIFSKIKDNISVG